MDELEKEYFEKITRIASDFKNKRRELGKSRIKMFSAALYRLLIDLNEKHDVLIGSGNSGSYMTKIAGMVYKDLDLKLPLILSLPIYRFDEDNASPYDNSPLVPKVKEVLENFPVKNVLFVDDEIMKGITAKECFSLILNARPDIKSLSATIVAENHFFEWHYKIPQVSIRFFAYSRLIQGLNGNIGYFIPEDLFKKISSLIPEVNSHNHSMALIVAGVLKKRYKELFFDNEIEQILINNLENYSFRKSQLIKELEDLVKEGIEDYKSGKIKFKF